MLRRSLAVVSRVAPLARVSAASRMVVTPATRLPATSLFTTPRRFGGHDHHDSDEFEKLYKEMAMKAAVDPIQEGQRTDDAYTPGDDLDRLSGLGAFSYVSKMGLVCLISILGVFALTFCDTDNVPKLSAEERERIQNLLDAHTAKVTGTDFTPVTAAADAAAAATSAPITQNANTAAITGVKRAAPAF